MFKSMAQWQNISLINPRSRVQAPLLATREKSEKSYSPWHSDRSLASSSQGHKIEPHYIHLRANGKWMFSPWHSGRTLALSSQGQGFEPNHWHLEKIAERYFRPKLKKTKTRRVSIGFLSNPRGKNRKTENPRFGFN